MSDFDKFFRMKNNITVLEKKAIDAALTGNWNLAVEINKEILEIDPESLDAKLRLGKAYLQLEEFNKAKKLYKEVLEKDPVNQTALRNLKLASDKKVEKTPQNNINTGALIIEPGLTQDVEITIEAKRVMADDFSTGEALEVRVDKNSVMFYRGEELIGSLTSDIVPKLQSAKTQHAIITSAVVDGSGKSLKLLVCYR